MYSLNDITNSCPIKVESPQSSCNGHSSEMISINGMPVVKTEKLSASCNTVSQETISLPQEIVYEVHSIGEINTEEDVLNIQISNVQGATSDQNVVKNKLVTSHHGQTKNSTADDERLALSQTASHVEKLSDQEMQPRFEVDPNTKSPVAESFSDGQLSKSMMSQEERCPVETEVQSPVNQSRIPDGDQLTETTAQEKAASFQLNSHEPEILPSNHLSHPPGISQISNQYPSSAYRISTNGTLSPYQADTQGTLSTYQNGTPEIVSTHHMTTAMPSVYMTTPLYHMATHGEMPGSQLEANMYYQMNYGNEMPAYHGGYNSHSPQLTKPLSHSMISNQQKGAHSCNCCCHAQNESSHYPAFGMEAPRPSVIMVPVNRHTAASALSHVPFKVDSNPYMMPLKNLDYSRQDFADQSMEYSDDSDSSDDDGNRKQKKYFRKNIDGTTARFKLTKEDWARIPINTFPSGGRLLSGDWTRIFLSKVKESNPWCSLRFKNNHVRSENSRKIHSAVFFRGGAECKRPECNVKVRFVIRKEKGKHVDVTYVGDVCHDSQPGRTDVLDDRKRKKIVRRTCSS